VTRVRYLDLADFLLIAEAVLGVGAEELAYATRIDLAESALASPSAGFGGHEFYPTLAEKAAVLCHHLVRNHPLVDGNKRVGYLCLVEFVERNGYSWTAPAGDDPSGDETVHVIERVAAGSIDPAALALWVENRMTPAQG
jgi:death on curing protein